MSASPATANIELLQRLEPSVVADKSEAFPVPNRPVKSPRGFVTVHSPMTIRTIKAKPTAEQYLDYRPGSLLSDIAKFVMQMVLMVVLGEALFQRRVISDALMLGIFIIAFGWWLTVRRMRQEIRQEFSGS